MLKLNGIDPNKYNSDKVYKMIKKFRIAYNSLNKESILSMIQGFEKSSKNGKGESGMLLKNKTSRKKAVNFEKENLYSEKVNKRNSSKI